MPHRLLPLRRRQLPSFRQKHPSQRGATDVLRVTAKAALRARANRAVADAVANVVANAGTAAKANAVADVAASVVTENVKAASAANLAKDRPKCATKRRSVSPGRHVSHGNRARAADPARVSVAVAAVAAIPKRGMSARTGPTHWKVAYRKVQLPCRKHSRARAQCHRNAHRAAAASVEIVRIATTVAIEMIAMQTRRAIEVATR